MRMSIKFTLVALCLSVGGCAMYGKSSGTEISDSGPGMRNDWTATLVTPSTLSGAVQVRGTANWMHDGSGSKVMVSISNATPGGRHPWHIHSGRCGGNGPIVGDPSAYKALEVNGDGNANENASLSMPLPSMSDYYVNIHASPENMGTIIACGNLAAPVR